MGGAVSAPHCTAMSLRPGLAAALAGVALTGVALTLGGCASLGAQRLPADRLDYTDGLRESDAAEILSNVVALRFGKSPTFLTVSSVVSQYVREGFFNPDPRIPPYGNDPAGTLSAQALVRETPTVTYTPLAGEKFVRALLAPIPPPTLLSMLQAGWAIDELMDLTVRAINGVHNASRAPLFAEAGDGRFEQVLGALRRLQLHGALSFRLTQHDQTFSAHVQLRPDLTETDRADAAIVQRDLGMGGAALTGEVEIVFAEQAANPRELAVATRSLMEVLQVMSLGVDVAGDGRSDPRAPVRVYSGPHPPPVVYSAVRRGRRWYWIAVDDEASQRAILLAEVLMAVNAQAEGQKAPLITIPAG